MNMIKKKQPISIFFQVIILQSRENLLRIKSYLNDLAYTTFAQAILIESILAVLF